MNNIHATIFGFFAIMVIVGVLFWGFVICLIIKAIGFLVNVGIGIAYIGSHATPEEMHARMNAAKPAPSNIMSIRDSVFDIFFGSRKVKP